jgi:hypothetical protein
MLSGVTETGSERRLRYDDVVRRVVGYHRERGEIVDFYMMKGGQIVASYRLRRATDAPWQDLLPTDTKPRKYHEVIQRLVPILFPDEAVEIETIVRDDADVTVRLAPPRPPAS